MYLILSIFLMLTSFLAFSSERFGEPVVKDRALAINEVLKNDSTYRGKEILVSGLVEKVCVKKGCWLNLKAGAKTVRVTFKDYGIFVPSTFLGKSVVLKGVFDMKEESIERRKHLMEDEGRSRDEIDQVKTAHKIYSVVASGIETI